MNDKEITRTSKFLRLILRHEPERVGLKLGEAGWVSAEELLQAVNRHGVSLTLDQLKHIVEHEQWMHWSQAVAVDVADATRVKWQRWRVDYSKLTDDLKEADRVWARRVVTLLRQRRLIP